MKKLLPTRSLFVLLALSAAAPACKLPDQFCVGDCLATTTTADSDSASSVTAASSVTDADDTTDGGPQGDTGVGSDTGDSADPPPEDPPPTCELVDDYPAPPTCQDGTAQPGELCYAIGASGTTYPQGIFSALAMRLDAAGDDLLVSDVSGNVSASTFAQGPGLTQTDLPLWSPAIDGEVVISGAGDFDHDGDLDFTAHIGDPGGDSVAVVFTADAAVQSVTVLEQSPGLGDPHVTDWDDDGNLDVVVRLPPGRPLSDLRVHLGDGAGNFNATGEDGYSLLDGPFVVAALGSDGIGDDIVIGRDDGRLDLLMRLPQRFDTGMVFQGAVVAVASADLDGDGDGDVVAIVRGPDLTSEAVVLLHHPSPDDDPTHTTLAMTHYTVHCNALAMALADLDSDGAIDIVALSSPSEPSLVTILRNDGAGGFPQALTVPLPAAVDLLVADLNGDGAPELIGVNGSTSTIAIAPAAP